MPRRPFGWPNRISLARAILVGPFAYCLLALDDPARANLRHLALAIYAALAISDFLDGYLARKLGQFSDLGRLLDPISDKLLIITSFLLLAIVGVAHADPDAAEIVRLPVWVVAAALGKDLLVCLGFAIYYLVSGHAVIEPSHLGKSCTAVQLVVILAMLLAPDLPIAARSLPALFWIAALAALAAALDYVRVGLRVLASPPHRKEIM